MVTVPSVSNILGDKLTAFAPNTSGIPYLKGDRDCSLEIIKQVYDVGRLFERIDNFAATAEVFNRIGKVELEYRHLSADLTIIYEDIRQTALCIATRGQQGRGQFEMLQGGVKKIGSLIYSGKYHIEQCITDSARAAYLATAIEKGCEVEKYPKDPFVVLDMKLTPTVSSKLSKLRRTLPEAYYYWTKISELL
jgi:hypothetical protein